MRSSFYIGLLFACALIFEACTTYDCSINNIVALNVSLSDTLEDDTLNVYTIVNGTDTALYTNGTEVTSVSLPMSYSKDVDQYLFAFTDTTGSTTIDTLSVTKTNQPYFESVECTPQFWHNIQGVTSTHNMIDSITINDSIVNNDQTKQHIIITLLSD